jgi:predicted DNA-binding antitoxin AbrB/MazE fold protein
MTRVVTAVYEDGLLKPLQRLPLQEHQRVVVFVLPLDTERERVSYSPEWIAEMEAQVEAWLRRQPADVLREPLPLSSAVRQAMNQAFDEALAAIRSHAVAFDDDEIAADVEAALAEVRAAPTAERRRLEAEVQALLDEIAADVF